MVKGSNYLPVDIVLDYLRDFVGISRDVKKRSEEIYADCEELYDFVIEMFLDTALGNCQINYWLKLLMTLRY